MHGIDELRALRPTKDFCVGIDSDGCVFDTMVVKHEQCFCPAFISHFGLEDVRSMAEEVWRFVNLYSRTRGCNRFKALQRVLMFMKQRLADTTSEIEIGPLPGLDAWLQEESSLGNATLIKRVEAEGDADLVRVLAWSLEVNERVQALPPGVQLFDRVRACIESLQGRADAIVVTQTPHDTVKAEWDALALTPLVRFIAAQEIGTKTEHLGIVCEGHYASGNALMIGDAPGDFDAADANGVLFFPIIPGSEERSWQRLVDEGLAHFFAGTFAGKFQDELVAEFNQALPKDPDW